MRDQTVLESFIRGILAPSRKGGHINNQLVLSLVTLQPAAVKGEFLEGIYLLLEYHVAQGFHKEIQLRFIVGIMQTKLQDN